MRLCTLDSRGCLTYFKKGGKTVEELVASIKVDKVIDTTGCGDSFAGGLSYGLVQNPTDYVGAAKYGNAFGALRTQGKTFDVFKSLEETNAIIEKGHMYRSLNFYFITI
jgi:adenosine kinase